MPLPQPIPRRFSPLTCYNNPGLSPKWIGNPFVQIVQFDHAPVARGIRRWQWLGIFLGVLKKSWRWSPGRRWRLSLAVTGCRSLAVLPWIRGPFLHRSSLVWSSTLECSLCPLGESPPVPGPVVQLPAVSPRCCSQLQCVLCRFLCTPIDIFSFSFLSAFLFCNCATQKKIGPPPGNTNNSSCRNSRVLRLETLIFSDLSFFRLFFLSRNSSPLQVPIALTLWPVLSAFLSLPPAFCATPHSTFCLVPSLVPALVALTARCTPT